MTYDIDAVRGRFPALALSHGAADERRPRIYLDNPAGTQVPDVVLDRMRRAMVECNANMHGEFHTSREATELVHQAHLSAADLYNAASEREIVFGANMTTLTFHLGRALGRGFFKAGDEVVVTELDHHANSDTWRALASERGLALRVVRLRPETGQLDADDLEHALTPRTRLVAIGAASNALGSWRLSDCTLYVTLEPCPMCAAAMAHARIARLVFGAWDPRQGAAGSAFNLVAAAAMNHRVDAFGGVLSEECGELLRRFFADRR